MKITCAKLAGGPGGQNHDIHLTFPGLRLQRGYQVPPCDVTIGHYVTITKPRSALLSKNSVIQFVCGMKYNRYVLCKENV